MVEMPMHFLGIAPYDGMKTAMERAAEVYPNVHLDAFIGDLDDGAAIVKQNLDSAYDCIISRGGTAELIRQITDIPVVEIYLSVYDVLRSIKLAENYTNQYAIVGFPSITNAAHILCDLLQIPLDIFTIHNTEETYETLTKLKNDGYRMVLGDMVTQTAAYQLGMDAFLITSGIEALQSALEQAVALSAGFRRLRQENTFLRYIAKDGRGSLLVLDDQEECCYSTADNPKANLLNTFREKIPDIPERSALRYYYNDNGDLYSVSAQKTAVAQSTYYLFYYTMVKIPIRSDKMGLRSFSHVECDHLLSSSFYAISGAMGTLGPAISSIAATRDPVMILGENGTGKEQIARYIYLHSAAKNRPMIVVDCELAVDKTWDYLLNHFNSPFNESGSIIYLQHLEFISAFRSTELLSLILDTGLLRRQKLIFSCVCNDKDDIPSVAIPFIQRLGCMTLHLPALRNRRNEISSLASLYLGSLNQEMGKQISGFEPRAMEQLRTYDWPNNYTQFRKTLQYLAALTNSAYIKAQDVAEVLSQERNLTQKRQSTTSGFEVAGHTLEEIIQEAVHQTLSLHNGNQTAAAKQLGISRTTMWRYLNMK